MATAADPQTPAAAPPAPPAAVSAVTVVGGADALAAHADAWAALAASALEPNPFYEPWMLLPALRAFAGPDVLVALVHHPDPARPHGPPLLTGLFPLQRLRRYKGLPVAALRLWQHLHCFLCTPLLHHQLARETLLAFLHWLKEDRQGAPLLELNFVAGGGPFDQLVIDVLNERRLTSHAVESFNRALLCRGDDAERYLGSALSTGNRKELRRQRRRLGECGTLEARTLAADGDAATWVEQFLALEGAGWKGAAGSALAARAAECAYFRDIARAAAARGRLMMLGLFLDGRPVALKCNFLAGDGAFAFKIAFDEAFARFSPGVQLELDNVHALHARPGLRWMDSCAVANHFMINRLWRERRTVRTLLIAPGGWRGELALASLPLLTWVKNQLRRRPPATP